MIQYLWVMSEKRGVARLWPPFLICVWFVLVICGGCATAPPPVGQGEPRPYKIDRKWYKPIKEAKGFTEKGYASWYGKKFHGRKTANGEIYDMYGMTAAHKTLPLGTVVQVCNLSNKKCVVVRVNDRGPFVRGRIIDLTYTAAKKIDMIGPGTAPVIIKAVRPPEGKRQAAESDPSFYYKGNFTIQVAAFTQKANAERLCKKLSKEYKNAHIAEILQNGQMFFRVRVGRCFGLEEAKTYEALIEKRGFPNAFVVAE